MVEPTNFKQILDSLMTAVIVLDSNLKIYHINISAETLLGVSAQQFTGKTIRDCFNERDDTPDTLKHAVENGENFTKRHVHWKLHNHTEITVDYTVTPNPELHATILEVQPLDRILKISREEAMLSVQETSRNLVRSMAHEIKNPLGGIRGSAQLLSRELETESLNEYTRIIIDETDRLRDLVDRMLGPRVPPRREPLNIHEILEHVSSIIRAEAENRISVIRDYDPSIPTLLGDKGQLIQATLNIVRNAMQILMDTRTDNSGVIRLSTRVKRRFTIGGKHHPLVAQISIIDNGPGIAPELINDIFFPMITGRPDGTGLGLAIAQTLISQQQGLIECESAPGHTNFTIYLPLDDDNAEA